MTGPLKVRNSGEAHVQLALCADGSYDCGGATARIDIGEQEVTWSDFQSPTEPP